MCGIHHLIEARHRRPPASSRSPRRSPCGSLQAGASRAPGLDISGERSRRCARCLVLGHLRGRGHVREPATIGRSSRATAPPPHRQASSGPCSSRRTTSSRCGPRTAMEPRGRPRGVAGPLPAETAAPFSSTLMVPRAVHAQPRQRLDTHAPGRAGRGPGATTPRSSVPTKDCTRAPARGGRPAHMMSVGSSSSCLLPGRGARAPSGIIGVGGNNATPQCGMAPRTSPRVTSTSWASPTAGAPPHASTPTTLPCSVGAPGRGHHPRGAALLWGGPPHLALRSRQDDRACWIRRHRYWFEPVRTGEGSPYGLPEGPRSPARGVGSHNSITSTTRIY